MRKSDRMDAVERSHRIVELLAGRYFDGIGNAELAAEMRESPANISRDLARLEAIGYVRKLDIGRWALTPYLVGIAQKYTDSYNRMQNRIAEVGRNIMAAARRD